MLGGRYSKKYLLSLLYLARAVVIAIFVLLPISAASVLIFSAAMGLLWLSTVPLTSGLVAQFFGTRHMAMLFGIVFFRHQVGAFLGVWLGGYFFDATRSEEHTSELQSLMRMPYAVFCWKKKKKREANG